MRFFELLAELPNVSTTDQDVTISAPVTDNAQAVQPGGVFVARQGAQFDGHALIPQAIANGAAAVVGERAAGEVACAVPYASVPDARLALAPLAAAYYGFPSRDLIVIGVTGTDGKTTTVSILYSILRAAGVKAGMISTVSAVIGDRTLETGLHVTTPRAPEVQQYLAEMVAAGMTHCVLETTSHGLAQGRVDAIDIDVAVITNIQHEHLDYHGSWEAYRDAKGLLFRRLMQSAYKPGQDKVAVVNADDAASAAYLRSIPADRHLSYAIAPQLATFQAQDVTYGPSGTMFSVRDRAVASPLVGDYNVSNVLAAMTAAFVVGVPMDLIGDGVARVPQIPGRMERIDEGQPFLAVVDFAHTPNSLRQVLLTARTLIGSDHRVICAVGSAGLRDREKRRMMAEIAAELADLTVLTAEDPRTESLDDILAEMAEGCQSQGGVEGETFFRVPDRGQALFEAVQYAAPGDIVLACGKGHEQSMCFGTIEYPWDDRDALRAALRGMPLQTLPTALAGE